ncbi:formylglycine-generating enzyme family protein [Mycolicibacterium sp. ELW1]|uniref:formylglycine-generating enzyme family protein n=1 Tax=Mycobacteriaceae TaxID=1762 RepID=UPI0011EDC705|nr:formylglycine-generating enzyme family protein [Mycobacterium sp. ELW1]QEN12768.1 formylglycine-generating enzyme family protein [Mycobacterium sp. ELW1]
MLTELVEVPGGAFRMGSTNFYPEEAPIHTVTVDAFAIERHPVTNAQFAEFVAATGHVTVAEKPLDPALYPGVPQADLQPGALVFRSTAGPVDLRDWRQWWDWAPGANWRAPFGPGSSIAGKANHPVVQVAYPDAAAYARWAGRRLPTEAEWEYAARAGSTTEYAWGAEPTVDGSLMANTWQGRFPYRNDGALGWTGTSPVGTFPPNRLGLVDMIGNVWEWTTTRFSAHHLIAQQNSCCPPPTEPDPTVSQALKGGSHLCAPEYCHRYRPAARSPQSQDTSTTHIGFRCVVNCDDLELFRSSPSM